MTTTEPTQTAPDDHVGEEHTDHEHPSDWKYVQIAIILAVLTAAEVATYYFEEELGAFLIPVLIVLMVVKFTLVIMWFMHLKFDSPLFTRTFVGGLVLAVGVYCAALATFEFWSS